MSRKLYISDPHWDHKRIIELAKRPFSDVDEMNETMVRNWNEAYQTGDTIFCLGDFAWANHAKWFNRLAGDKHLILGNHDHDETKRLRWSSVRDYARINDEGHTVILFHYPIYEFDKLHRGAVHLFGHVHGKETRHATGHHDSADHRAGGTMDSRAFDVGVERIGYKPRTLEEIMSNYQWLSK